MADWLTICGQHQQEIGMISNGHEAKEDPAFFAQSQANWTTIEHLLCGVQEDIKEAHKVELKEVSLCLFLCSILTVK